MSEMVRAMVAGEDNRGSFDCAAHGVSSFAQDDSFVGGASEEQMRGFFATTPASKLAGDPGFPLRMTSVEAEPVPCSLLSVPSELPVPSDDEDGTPFDKLREECGVMAVYGHPEAARMTYWGLYALQHRGQESAGIAAADGSDVTDIKGMGLVSEIFT